MVPCSHLAFKFQVLFKEMVNHKQKINLVIRLLEAILYDTANHLQPVTCTA
jgi:hypothetical protein